MIWHLIEKMDLDMHRKAKYDRWQLDDQISMAAVLKEKTNAEVVKLHREKVQLWFGDGPDKLKGSGDAFAVFRYSDDRDEVLNYLSDNPDFKLTRGSHEVMLRPIITEPTGIFWWFIGIPK